MKTSYRVTSDGNRSALHNGLVEWIYECKIIDYFKIFFQLGNLPENIHALTSVIR